MKDAYDRQIDEAALLMGNLRDTRSINLFNSHEIEMPAFCKKKLS